MANPKLKGGIGHTSNFDRGITTASFDQTLGNYLDVDPSKMCVYFDDFLQPADMLAAVPVCWTVTKVGTGTITQPTGATGVNGRLLLTTTAASGDSVNLQLKQDSFSVIPASGSARWYFKTKFRVSNVATTDVIIGLTNITTTPLTATDGIYIQMATGGALAKVVNRKASTSTTSNTLSTLVAATDITLGMWYSPFEKADDGSLGCVKLYVNDVIFPQKLNKTNIPSTTLAVTYYIKTNTTAAASVNIDYALIATENQQNEPVR